MIFLWLSLACGRPVPSVLVDSADPKGAAVDSESADDSGSAVGDTGDPGTGFRAVVVPLYAEKCEACHGYWGSSEDADALWQRMLEDAQQSLIRAHEPADSIFYTKMLSSEDPDAAQGERMPLQAPAVSSEQLDALEEWIDAGAEPSGFEAYTSIHHDHDYRCQTCHEHFGAASAEEMYEVFVNTEVQGWALLEPGSASQSLIFVKVAGGEQPHGDSMPLNYSLVPDEELSRVEAWILSGALND